MEIIMVPGIVFLVIVAPIWIVMHYVYKGKTAKGISQEETADIEEMLETIDSLIERIETLEDILQEEHPQWKKATRRR